MKKAILLFIIIFSAAINAKTLTKSEKQEVLRQFSIFQEALETKADIIAAGCPFCNTMLTDGVKVKEKEGQVKVMDIAELIANAQDL